MKAQWGELAPQIIELKKREPSFDPMKFKETSALAYDAIISAFGKNDKNTLKDLVSPNAVSYTHLDVYKRQSIPRAATSICKSIFGCGPSRKEAGAFGFSKERSFVYLSLIHI